MSEERGIRFVAFVEIAPGNEQAHHLRLAGARRHLHHVARPILREHAFRDAPRGIVLQQGIGVAGALDFIEPIANSLPPAVQKTIETLAPCRLLSATDARCGTNGSAVPVSSWLAPS